MELDIQATSGNKKRLLVGLSWDDKPISQPSQRKNLFVNILGTIGHAFQYGVKSSKSEKTEDTRGRDMNYDGRDLDLLCFIFDHDKKFVREIGPDPDLLTDEQASVYHSGEEYTGEGVYDDEMIRLELNKLPDAYQHFVFVVVSDSKLSLAECGTFKLRLADSSTDKNFISEAIDAPADGCSAYIFAKVSRQNEVLKAEAIGRFTNFETAWETTLPALL